MKNRLIDKGLISRAAIHAALGDPARLALVEELIVSDRSPKELGSLIGLESNLLAHHLDVLEEADLIIRCQSSGDGRRKYVQLKHPHSLACSLCVPKTRRDLSWPQPFGLTTPAHQPPQVEQIRPHRFMSERYKQLSVPGSP